MSRKLPAMPALMSKTQKPLFYICCVCSQNDGQCRSWAEDVVMRQCTAVNKKLCGNVVEHWYMYSQLAEGMFKLFLLKKNIQLSCGCYVCFLAWNKGHDLSVTHNGAPSISLPESFWRKDKAISFNPVSLEYRCFQFSWEDLEYIWYGKEQIIAAPSWANDCTGVE